MPLPFSRSLRALDVEPDPLRRAPWVLLALGSLWTGWLFGARVQVAATVDGARIEAARVGHRVQAPVGGYLVAVHGELGAPVAAGDILLELDAATQERDRRRKLTEQAAIRQQLEALRAEVAVLERVLASRREARRVHGEEADVRRQKEEERARLREEERGQKVTLGKAGALPMAEVEQGISEARQQRAEAEAVTIAARRIRADQLVAEAEEAEKLAALRREAAALEGRLAVMDSELAQIAQEEQRRRIRAPVAGRLGELGALTAGAFVREGDTVATIIPAGDLRIVAQFPPEDVLGRIRPGQRGRIRLAAFPWTQYGVVAGIVARVAQEVRDGRVRVELSIDGESGIPLSHGLPGSVEIDVESASPAALVWRAAGRRLAPRRAPGS
jgi:membrane fusion protein (multidrug efflux system)